MTDLQLASEFPPASEADWLKRVAVTLKGADFEAKLVARTADGIRIAPLYGVAPGVAAGRAVNGPWQVMQRVDHGDAGAANAQALDDLAHGANGLVLAVAGAPAARGFGLGDAEQATLQKVFKDVALHAIAIRIDGGPNGRAAAQAMARLARQAPVNPELLDVAFGMDPIGVLAQRGFLNEPWPERAQLVSDTVKDLAQDFRGPYLEADGRVWHDGGASEAQEIGAVLATGAAYLRAVEGLGDAVMGRAIGVTMAANQDMFLTLAKFRALRLLWRGMMAACGLDGAPRLHAETSWRMMARLDPHTNILRASAAVFGAGLGGADSVTVLPFPLAQGLPDSFARRVARNTQTVLLEESHLWRVADPAAGAGYVEHLTEELCERGWAFFQATERQGGIAKALETRWLQGEIRGSRDRLLASPPPIIGTSAYRLPTEYRAAIEIPAPAVPAAAAGAIVPVRLAQAMEPAT